MRSAEDLRNVLNEWKSTDARLDSTAEKETALTGGEHPRKYAEDAEGKGKTQAGPEHSMGDRRWSDGGVPELCVRLFENEKAAVETLKVHKRVG